MYEWRERSTQDANELISERDPRSYPWGFFRYADAPGGIGGGVGSFSWFSSLEEMLAFIAEFEPRFWLEDKPDEMVQLQRDLDNIFGRVLSGNHALERAIEQANARSSRHWQITWIGEFTDLREGLGEFGREVIENYRQEREDVREQERPEGVDTSAITEEELTSFVESLRTYGT